MYNFKELVLHSSTSIFRVHLSSIIFTFQIKFVLTVMINIYLYQLIKHDSLLLIELFSIKNSKPQNLLSTITFKYFDAYISLLSSKYYYDGLCKTTLLCSTSIVWYCYFY